MSNLKVVNFLDITFNLSEKSFKPFRIDKQTPSYIDVNSNHPRSIDISMKIIHWKKNYQENNKNQLFMH